VSGGRRGTGLRVLYVTAFAPSLRTGGGLHAYANVRTLCALPSAEVAYVGPPIRETLVGLERLSPLVCREYTWGDKIRTALSGAAATSVAMLLREAVRVQRVFDVMFVETTRLGGELPDSRGALPTICCVHNVEADFIAGRRGLGRVAGVNVRRAEAESLRRSQHLLVMHEHDLARLATLYDAPGLRARTVYHPVCSVGGEPPVPMADRERRIVIPGSLDQNYNQIGIMAFLRECWPSLRGAGAELVIAGRNPRPSLRDAVHAAGAVLIENPGSMRDIVKQAVVVAVPDLGGAGMKLRVAEALSLGVPVVGTREGLFGYADANDCGRAVDSVAAMAAPIRDLVQHPDLAAELASRARAIWEEKYSFDAFSARLGTWVRDWIRAT
jgi:hypothetical protein